MRLILNWSSDESSVGCILPTPGGQVNQNKPIILLRRSTAQSSAFPPILEYCNCTLVS